MFNDVRRLFGSIVQGRKSNSLPEFIRQHFDFKGFRRTIGYRPKEWKLFIEAMLHRSYVQQFEEGWRSNERLEFLGDAVLNFVVAEYLHAQHPAMEEGDLTKIRSRLVNRKVLALRARELRISNFLLLSASAAQSIDQGSESILSDAFEALIGAVYVDGGTEAARKFVHRTLLMHRGTIDGALLDSNYKSALLEYSQARSMGVPRYTIVREDGPDHDRTFTVEVFVGPQSYGTGVGRSKKDAEQAAAARALELIQKNKSQ